MQYISTITKKPIILFLGLCLVLSHSLTAHSQNKKHITANDSIFFQEDKNLEEVVVTASRTRKFLKDLAIPTQVVGPKDINVVAPQNFIDLLQFTIPGFEFSKHGGRDVLSYRGFGGEDFLFLVDGEQVSMGSGNEIDFDRINSDNIERIEFVRGAASALYGSNALAGVINVITKTPRSPYSIKGMTFINSKMDQRYNINIGINKNKISSVSDASYNYTSPFVIVDEEKNKIPVYENVNFNISQKFKYTPTKNLILKASANYNSRKQKRNELLNFSYKAFDATTSAVWSITSNQSLDFSYHYNYYKHDSLLLKSKITPIRNVFGENMHHLRLQYNIDLFSQHTLNIGSEYINDQVNSARLNSPKDKGIKVMHTGILYGQYSYEPIKFLTMSYGGRLDIRNAYGAHYTNRVTIKYNPIDPVILRASFSQGYRTPSMQELYFYFDHMGMFYVLGNEKLRPEKSNMLFLSAEYNKLRYNITTSFFFTKLKDRIATIQEGNNYHYVNTSSNNRDLILGWDINAHAKLPFGFTLRASYAYTYNKYVVTNSKGLSVTDKQGNLLLTTLTRPHSIVSTLSWNHSFTKNYHLNANLALRYLSGFDGYIINDKEKPIKTHYSEAFLARIGINQTIYKYVDLDLGIDNLFNYQPNKIVFNSPITAPRTYNLTLRLKI